MLYVAFLRMRGETLVRVDLSQRGAMLVAMALAVVVLVLATVAVLLFLPAKTVSGQVVDGESGQPLSGAVLKANGLEIKTEPDGSFSIEGIRFGTTVVVEAKGYQPASSIVTLGDRLRLVLSQRTVRGTVVDEVSGKPLAGAELVAGSLTAKTDEQGRFLLKGVDPGDEISAVADGFRPLVQRYDGQAAASLVMKPNVLSLQVLDQYTGQLLAGAEVVAGQTTARTDQQGRLQWQYARNGAQIEVRMERFAPATVVFDGQELVQVALRPNVLSGTVKDSRGGGVKGALVSNGHSTVITDETGAFTIKDVPENASLTVTANGYERKRVEVGRQTTLDIVVSPFSAKGLYLTYYGVGSDELRNHVLELAAQTEINSVVIDIKGDRGWIAYNSGVPMVKEIGAQQEVQIPDPKKFLADLHQRCVYTIARIVVFKDNPLATARPDLAVINSQTGQPWVDNEGLRWTDPTREEVWDYNIALAVEAIQNGFDEVQFDYVRFPTDASAGNSLDSITFSQANTMANRTAAINGFLEKARSAIHAAGGSISVDIFGYVVWREDDMGIGQHLEDVAQRVDYVSPMVYPTLFWDGILVNGEGKYGNQQAGLYPYEIVSESMKLAVKRIGAAKLRPWLQYYNDYLTGKSYTADDIMVQKQATYESGVTGWMFWDPSNRFAKGGFEPKR